MLNIFGPANNLGTGIHCMNLAKAYEALGHDVCLIPPFGNVSVNGPHVDRWLANRLRFSPRDPSLMIFDLAFMSQFSGTPRIGMAVFETDGLTPLQRAMLASCDLVLTPSTWGRGVLAAHGIDADVVPEGYDPDSFPFLREKTMAQNEFVFLHVGKYEERKGTLQLIRCFAAALEGESATLVMHVENPFINDYSPINRTLDGLSFSSADGRNFRRLGLRIRFTQAADAGIQHLYHAADCAVFPSRGEGWGLPVMEAIVTGVPTITGRWTAMGDYVREDYCPGLLLAEGKREAADDGVWFRGDRGNWVVPSDESLVESMRWAFKNARDARRTEEWLDQVTFARKFTWANAAGRLEAAIKI